MITIALEFYDKKTEFIVDENRLELPDDVVFRATESQNIDYINSHPFEVSQAMKGYIIKHYPDLEEKFDLYLYSFIGRHGLGEGY